MEETVCMCFKDLKCRGCQVKVCDRCLKKRYIDVDPPQMTEEEAASDDWKCPKCSGNCNCSACRKQAGLLPLGRLVPNSEKPSEEEPAEGSEPKGEEDKQSGDVAAKGKWMANAPREPRRAKDVRDALQFIEFCVAFEEVLGFSKAQAESLFRDLMLQQYSSVFHFQATLLSLQKVEIELELRPLKDLNEDTWFEYMRCYFSESQILLKELPSDFFSRGVEGYKSLDFSQKLRVLNFLCDEALVTDNLSNFIKGKGEMFNQRKSEAKQMVSAAKAKEISLKEQLRTEVAKAKE
ncbi:uncharacterized protein LOC126802108 [Argentina anserina]|uniref:uncharacterized protein LOC126802108 n=1 Tax=Argentina anserina TaxID=57926 RepID=UPI00217659C9|nr:uncharacterized protein LOC126802108 [Potentilla anserina]